jgi:probable metal-binding protein
MSNTATDSNSIHGHDVIHLVHQAAQAASPFTRQTLAAEISRRFGDGVRFHTCSAEGMTLDQLLAFLLMRGKVVERAGVLTVNIAEVCGHGDHHHD